MSDNEYADERLAMERTGAGARRFQTLNPTENFKVGVVKYANQLLNKDFLTESEIKYKLNLPINDIPDVKYLNAKAYVLGFIGSDKSKKSITEKSILKAVKAMESSDLENELITVDDIIRYSYLWIDRINDILASLR